MFTDIFVPMTKSIIPTSFTYTNDSELVSAVMAGNNGALHYMLYDHYTRLLKYNAAKATKRKAVEYDDLVQELYLYLSKDDWAVLRRYDPALPFEKWFSVVSYRCFKDYCRRVIDPDRQVPIDDMNDHSSFLSTIGKDLTLIMDIRHILNYIHPPRDRQILEGYILRDEAPEEAAVRYGITVANYYNIKSRALKRFIKLFGKDK